MNGVDHTQLPDASVPNDCQTCTVPEFVKEAVVHVLLPVDVEVILPLGPVGAVLHLVDCVLP